jgi:branched-chain amino acid transport system ATP-binding protein
MLRIVDVYAGYGPLRVLWGIHLEVHAGELVALVGANGAGKTTLLRVVSGLLPPEAGALWWGDRRLDGLSPAAIVRLGISHVPEGRHIFPGLTVADNLRLGAAMLPQAWARLRESLDWVYGLFPRLRERLDQRAGTLSGGEQQMLAIARSLMSRPKLLLVDEPSLGLAPIVARQVFRTLEAVNREGVAVLLVEQDVRASLSMAHRGYVLENGRIVRTGSGAELLHDPGIRTAYLGL